MKRTILLLSVLVAMAGTAPASAPFLGANPRLGESFLSTGIEQVAGDVSLDRLPDSGEAWLRRAAECFVAPSGITSRLAMLRSPKAAMIGSAKAPSSGPLGNLKNWWYRGAENDAAWRTLPLNDKVYYEIGQKTLPTSQFSTYAGLDPVARGRALVQDVGWWQALKPQGSGWVLGVGETLSTGSTPLVRWAVPRAAGATAAGGAGYYLYRSSTGDGKK